MWRRALALTSWWYGTPFTRQGRALRRTLRDMKPSDLVEVHRPTSADLPIGTVVRMKPNYSPEPVRVQIRGYDMFRSKYRGVPEVTGRFPEGDGWLWFFPGEILEVEE